MARFRHLFVALSALALSTPLALAQHGADPHAAPAPAAQPPAASVADVLSGLDRDTRDWLEHVTTLSNQFFEGRVPGSRGNALAAEYIRFHFEQLGLTPAFEDTPSGEKPTPNSSYFQGVDAGSKLNVRSGSVGYNGTTISRGESLGVLDVSGSGSAAGPITFVGYSLAAGQNGYASYPDNTDLKGQIALVFRFEPMTDDGKSQWIADGWSASSSLAPKLRAAASRGAAGIILVVPPGAQDPRADQVMDAHMKGAGASLNIPVVMISTDAAEQMLKTLDPRGPTLLDLRRAADKAGVVQPLGQGQVTVSADVAREPIVTSNVGAVLPGKGSLADQYVVIGAHYDHLGPGEFGSRAPSRMGELHPGADDNASGTAGLIMVARKLAADYAKLPDGASARSILFLGFTAEESGLIGSRYFVKHPSVPIASISFMINMDMIGRLDPAKKLDVSGVGTAVGLEDLLAPAFASSSVPVAAKQSGAGPSDQQSFYDAGIPVLFLFTGLHREYHTPDDEYWTVNPTGAVGIIELCRSITRTIASHPSAFEFQRPGAPSRQADPHAPADPNQPGVGAVAVKVRFGIAPGDYSGDSKGVLVGEVYEKTSAAEAGLKTGDMIIKWNNTEVVSVEDWMPLLAQHNPGDVVEITYTRDGKTYRTHAILKARATGGG